MIYDSTRAGKTIPVTFEYHRANTTGDIAHDPSWRTSARDGEMRLINFRVIQTNRWRW
jgi:hypothetical protein